MIPIEGGLNHYISSIFDALHRIFDRIHPKKASGAGMHVMATKKQGRNNQKLCCIQFSQCNDTNSRVCHFSLEVKIIPITPRNFA